MEILLASPILHGAITGVLTAAAVDYQAFTGWKSFEEARAYSWSLALWRWAQGAVIGLVSAAGLGALL